MSNKKELSKVNRLFLINESTYMIIMPITV